MSDETHLARLMLGVLLIAALAIIWNVLRS
jgi:hypothetical protein